jgi:lipoprotein NlpI
MTFPEEVSASVDPRAQSVSNKYFDAKVTDYFRGNLARKTVELKTLRPSVETADYPGYADDLRSFSKAVGGVYALNKAFLNAATSAKTDLTHRLQDQRLEAIKKTTEMIGNGKIAGADLATAYCMRASAQADLGHYEEALQDANTALRIAPTAAVPHQCRAEFYFISGQFEKSVADFSNGIVLGPVDVSLTYRGRGISRIYAGHIEEAGADFVKASELADVETKTYADMWLVATYGRLGKAIPPDLIKRAAAEAGGEWPHSGLAMMTGALSPEAMLKSLEKKQGDERQMALAEAYFYLGEHYLVTGDSKTAQSYFQKTRELGVIGYIEHNCAQFELERLKNQSATATARPATTPRAVAQ